MFDRRTFARLFARLKGWRAALLLLSAIPLVAGMYWWTGDWWVSIVVAAAVAIPVATVLLIALVDTSRSADIDDRLLGASHQIPSDLQSIVTRLDAVDLVVSSETRRPWEPTTLPSTFVGGDSPKPVLLLPGADYHLTEVTALADELDRRGIPNVIAVGIPHWERTGDGLVWYEREIYEAPTAEEIPGNYSALLTMKDWAGYAPLVEAAKSSGIPTFAKGRGCPGLPRCRHFEPAAPLPDS